MAAELTPLEQRMLDALFPQGDPRREPVLAALSGDLSFREPLKTTWSINTSRGSGAWKTWCFPWNYYPRKAC